MSLTCTISYCPTISSGGLSKMSQVRSSTFGASHCFGGACESDMSKPSSRTDTGTSFATLSNHKLCRVSVKTKKNLNGTDTSPGASSYIRNTSVLMWLRQAGVEIEAKSLQPEVVLAVQATVVSMMGARSRRLKCVGSYLP